VINTDDRVEALDKDMKDQTLLVVSNNPDTRSLIAEMLADKVSDVDTAHSTSCALEYSDEKKYDVAIIDESLKRARGQELFERMKDRQSGLKGILCSDRPTFATVDAALDSGMQHVIQKPIDPVELISIVSS
jgi:DNA-binding NtrC family response regulator